MSSARSFDNKKRWRNATLRPAQRTCVTRAERSIAFPGCRQTNKYESTSDHCDHWMSASGRKRTL